MKPLLLFIVLAGSAAADTREARKHYQRGTSRYDLADWQGAADEFKTAYELSRAPALLFNLAQCHRHLGQWEQAAHFYRTYLSFLPKAPNHAEAENYLREAEAELARPKPVEAPPPSPAPAPVEEAPLLLPAELPPATTMQAPPPPPRPRKLIIAGSVVAAAGVGLLVGGAVLGSQSASASDRIAAVSQGAGTWSSDFDSLYRQGQRDATAATALLITGGVVAAAGAVIAIVGAARRH
jgi:tetratricopeptide (TPR) repeat protein